MNKMFDRKILNNFLPIRLNIFWGAQKNRLIEAVLLDTKSIFLGRERRKHFFNYARKAVERLW